MIDQPLFKQSPTEFQFYPVDCKLSKFLGNQMGFFFKNMNFKMEDSRFVEFFNEKKKKEKKKSLKFLYSHV